MRNKAQILHGINAISCIVIGTMHTIAHYSELVTPTLSKALDHPMTVSGVSTNAWQLWQGMSLMMGLLLIIIGLLHLSILYGLDRADVPPVSASIIMIIMLCCVIYAGVQYFGSFQIYGGIAGMALQFICLYLSMKKGRA